MTTAHGMTPENSPLSAPSFPFASSDDVAMPTPEALARFSALSNYWEVRLVSDIDPSYPVLTDEDPETQGLREAFEYFACTMLNDVESVIQRAGDLVEHVCHMGVRRIA